MPFSQYRSGGGGSRWGSSSSSKDPIGKVENQINNAKVRIQSTGIDPNEDKRNSLEKFLNLPKNQNAFFDVLEILGRPAKGVVNAVDKAGVNPLDYLSGKEKLPDLKRAGTAFMQGLTGRERNISGSDVAQNKLGIDNKLGKLATGFIIEAGVDPLNLVPGKAFAKPFEVAGKGISKGYQAAENLVPALETVKDGFGKAFKYQYKWDDTLTGAKDDTMKNLFNATENDIKFRTEESLKNIADTAKITGVETGDEVGRLMEQKLPSNAPGKTYSADPKIQKAAQNLMQSNDELRQWALDNDIEVKELEGYMAHILSEEERVLKKKNKPIRVDQGNFGIGQPNKKILNTRELEGSVEDINQQMGRKFFEPNAYFSTAIGQKRLVEYVNAAKFRRDVLSNSNFAVPYQRGMVVPDNAVVINSNNYSFMRNPSRQLPDEIGGDYIVTKGVKEALDRYQKLTTDEGVNALLGAYDKVLTTWKKFALFSPAYHLRNMMGAMFNNWIGGMSPGDLTLHTSKAMKEVTDAVRGKESSLFREYRQQGLAASNLSKVEFRTSGNPEKDIMRTIEERSGNMMDQVLLRSDPLRAFETSREIGDVMDQTNRFALYSWARKKGMSPEEAANKVREVQFDYSRTTKAESEVMARMIPFYRWMRNNIPFQIKQFMNDPRKYSNLNKLRVNAQDTFGIEDENVPDYMKESFAIPVSGDGKGSGKFLSLNLPVGDINRVAGLDNIGKTLVDSLSPIGKVPVELAMNRNFFYDKPIQKFEGQEKKYQVGNQEVGINPYWDYAIQAATGQIGRGMSSYLQKPEEVDQDTKYRTPSLGISSVLKDYDVEKSKYYQLLNELRKYQDMMDYIEQQTGERPKTIQELQR